MNNLTFALNKQAHKTNEIWKSKSSSGECWKVQTPNGIMTFPKKELALEYIMRNK